MAGLMQRLNHCRKHDVPALSNHTLRLDCTILSHRSVIRLLTVQLMANDAAEVTRLNRYTARCFLLRAT